MYIYIIYTYAQVIYICIIHIYILYNVETDHVRYVIDKRINRGQFCAVMLSIIIKYSYIIRIQNCFAKFVIKR